MGESSSSGGLVEMEEDILVALVVVGVEVIR